MSVDVAIRVLDDYFQGKLFDKSIQNKVAFWPYIDDIFYIVNAKEELRKERYGSDWSLDDEDLVKKSILTIERYLKETNDQTVKNIVDSLINDHTNDLINIIENFVDSTALNSYKNNNFEYRIARAFKVFPYRRIYNIELDHYLYKKLNVDFQNYNQSIPYVKGEGVLNFFMYFINYIKKYDNEDKIKIRETLKEFLDKYNLSYSTNLKKNWKLNPEKIYPDHQTIENNFKKMQDYNYSLVGAYGELQLYNEFVKNKELFGDVIWVSDEIGDGFGYDLLTIDENFESSKLYEVKTTTNPDNMDAFALSSNEYSKYVTTNNNKYNNSNYIIYNFLIDKDKILKTHVFSRLSNGKDVMYDLDENKTYDVDIGTSSEKQFVRSIKR